MPTLDVVVARLVALLCFLAAAAVLISQRRALRGRFPPSPPGARWLNGHEPRVPKKILQKALWAHRWGEEYGGLFTLRLGYTPCRTVVITNVEHARHLLELESSRTSDRPEFPVENVMSQGSGLTSSRYGHRFRVLKAGINAQTRARAVEAYHPLQELEACKFILELVEDPSAQQEVARRFTSSVALSATFALPSFASVHDEEIVVAERAAKRFIASITPENYLVNSIPWLKYLPSWVPGARWKTQAKEWYEEEMRDFERLYKGLEERQANGDRRYSMIEGILKDGPRIGYTRAQGLYMAGNIFRAGSATTARTVLAFLLSLVLFPDVQDRVQAEIDKVVGRERVPVLADVDNLPYLQALIKEVCRFFPIAPTGVMHAASEDFSYGPYVFPKGTRFWGNVWSINRDPAVYPDPHAFKPERFLDESGGVVTPRHTGFNGSWTFGFGRRACPGNHFAINSLLSMAMTTLWAVRIVRAKDDMGEETVPTDHDHVSRHPPNIPFVVKPRFPEWKELIRSHCREYSVFFGPKDHASFG